MPGFDGNTCFLQNLNFSDPLHTAFDHPGEFLVAGDIAIGTGEPITGQQIAVGQLTGAGGITITYSTPNLIIDGSGAGGGSLTVHTDAGDAVEAAGAISIVGAGTVTTSGAGSTITITGGGGGGGLTWHTISANQTLSVNSGYFCTAGATLSLLLPPVSALGDTIEISIEGSTGYTVTQGAGQSIKFGNSITTVGVGGSISSLSQGDSIRMVCKIANLDWVILSSMGNLTFV